jgi:3-phenylpropionate/trans-cinnamate dioxygenase ferredoxin reductase component
MTIMGKERPYDAKPWFWSDQFDVKLQIAGLSEGHEKVIVRQGGNGAVSYWYYRGPDLIAVDAMNDPRAYMVAKRLVDAGRSADPAMVEDPATDLKSLLL